MICKIPQIVQVRNEVYKRFHIPGCTEYDRRSKNAIYISPSNSFAHEKCKLELCYQLQKEKKQYITEAVDNETNLRRDIVCLDTSEIYEIESRKAKRGKRHDNTINVIYYD